jgi:putative NADPH-quinone reductase
MRKVLVINGHPDGSSSRFCHALAGAYAAGASDGGHSIRRLDLADLQFPLIMDRATFEGAPPREIMDIQQSITWCDHLVFVFPLWLGGPPARLKGLFEQVFRYGFALPAPGQGKGIGGMLKGRSARMIVTMGMPAPIFRIVFGAFGVRAIERGILRLCGFGPVGETLIGTVESMSAEQRQTWLKRVGQLGVGGR